MGRKGLEFKEIWGFLSWGGSETLKTLEEVLGIPVQLCHFKSQ